MIINELMIGDCVEYNGVACKVYSIESPFERKNEKFNNQYIATLWCNGFIYSVAEEIKPIPITEDILKENGFYNDGDDNYYHPILKGSYKGKFIDYLLNLHPTMIQYVHELQHALRLCGLNDLADGLKLA